MNPGYFPALEEPYGGFFICLEISRMRIDIVV